MTNKHLLAIRSGTIERTNIIGIRKALNAAYREVRGYSNGLTTPRLAFEPHTLATIERQTRELRPVVTGQLHDTGQALLRDKRYRKRWNARQSAIIASPDLHFRLADWIDVARGHYVPVYEAISVDGSFEFYNIPWQSAVAFGLETGPQITE